MEENEELNEMHHENHEESHDTLTKVTGMYKDWFLDYASYVILERAVPAIEDGFKPVQRRIMHSLSAILASPCSIILMETQVLRMLWCR